MDGKLLFVIHDPVGFVDVESFIKQWRDLARENGLKDFYFVGVDSDSRKKDVILKRGFDAILNIDTYNIHHNLSTIAKVAHLIERKVFKHPTHFKYKDAIKYMIVDDCKQENVMPTIEPNWDHSPRSGANAILLTGSTPDLFQQLAENAIDVVKEKPEEKQLIFIKSWNEWGEGNYMEPDLEFGDGYIRALRKAIDNKKNQ